MASALERTVGLRNSEGLGTQTQAAALSQGGEQSTLAEPLLGAASTGCESQQPAPVDRLGVCRKLAFAIGGVPNPITSIVTTFYLSPFLLEVARVRPASVGIIVLVGRVLDAFTDPLVGALSDHTKSRFGRRRPWMFFSIVPFACSFGALFWTWEIFGMELSSNATT